MKYLILFITVFAIIVAIAFGLSSTLISLGVPFPVRLIIYTIVSVVEGLILSKLVNKLNQ